MKYILIFLNLLVNTKPSISNISIDLSANLIKYKYLELYTGIHYDILKYEEIQGIVELLLTINKLIKFGCTFKTDKNINMIILLNIFKESYIQILINPFNKNISIGTAYNPKYNVAIYCTTDYLNKNTNNDTLTTESTQNISNTLTINSTQNINNALTNNKNIINNITNEIIDLIPADHKNKINFLIQTRKNILYLHLKLQKENLDETTKNNELKHLNDELQSLTNIISNAILWNKNFNKHNETEVIELNDQDKNLYNLFKEYLNNIKTTYNISIENYNQYQLLTNIIENNINENIKLETETSKNNDINENIKLETETSKNNDINENIKLETETSKNNDINENIKLETETSKNNDINENIKSNKSIYQIKQKEIQIILNKITIDIEKMWTIIHSDNNLFRKCAFIASSTYFPLHTLNKTIRYDLSELFNNNIDIKKITKIDEKFKIINENLKKLIKNTEKEKHIENILKIPKIDSNKNKLKELITNVLKTIEILIKYQP